MIGMRESALHAATQGQAVLTRQHQIEEDEIDPAVGQHLAHVPAVSGDADPEPLLGKRARDQIADLAMIIDDQDVRRVLHDKEYSRPGRTAWSECVSRCCRAGA